MIPFLASAQLSRVRKPSPPPPAGGGGWSPPYSLPASGQAVAISATNNAMSVNPANLSDSEFNYSLFESFGGGCYVADYSQGGAYVIGSSGGHIHPDFTGYAVFDFEDRTWKRIDPTPAAPNVAGGYTRAQCDLSEGEVSGFSPAPVPCHMYSNQLPLPTARGGGTKGSIVRVIGQAMSQDPFGTFRSHRFDLATGTWTRYSTNKADALMNSSYFLPECPTVVDPNTGRFYQLPSEIHNTQNIPYLDPNDATWKSFGSWDWPSNRGGENRMAFFDPVRNWIIAQRGGALLIGLDIAAPASGYFNLNVSGALPGGENRWEYYPTDGCFYCYDGSGQSIYKLTPPASSPKTNAWTVSTVTLTGATLPTDVNLTGNGTRHYTRFFYVSKIGCFAWIAGNTNDVILCKP